MPYPFGVDVAFNTVLTPTMVSSLDFAIPRLGTLGYSGIGTASYFTKYVIPDAGFLQSVSNMQAVQKPVGCYFFSYAWNIASAEYEATKVCDALDANNVSLEMPVFFDWEYDSDDKTSAAGYPVSNTMLQALTVAFMQKVNDRGRTAGWYANLDYVNNKYGQAWTTARMAEDLYFWLAEWGGSFSRTCDVWQYAGDVIWSGVDADLNSLIDERCVNGDIGHHVPKWLLALLHNRRRIKKPLRIGGI